MFYFSKDKNNNFKYNPFKACIVPRPIGWISSIDKNAVVNIAPYSYFNAVSDIPPTIMFASSANQDGTDKDTLKNIEENKEFAVNIASYELADQMNQSSTPLPYGVSEAKTFSIETTASTIIKTPRIKSALISLECEYIKTIEFEVDGKPVSSKIILGAVVGIYIDDSILTDGKIDITKLKPIARLGYNEYAVIEQAFKMSRP